MPIAPAHGCICVDTVNDGNNCGSCGNVCPGNLLCSGSTCTAPACSLFGDDFSDGSVAWTLDAQWEIAPAVASNCAANLTGDDPASDHSPSDDDGVAGVDIGGCYDLMPVSYPDRCMTSPVVDTSGKTAIELSFWRHLHADYPPFISSTVDVTTDGMTWTSIFSNPQGNFINDVSWTLVTFDVSAYASTTFQLRFCYHSAMNGVVAGGGWSIDDLDLVSCN